MFVEIEIRVLVVINLSFIFTWVNYRRVSNIFLFRFCGFSSFSHRLKFFSDFFCIPEMILDRLYYRNQNQDYKDSD